MESEIYGRICELVYDEAGIRIRPGKEAMVSSRLAKRMRALGITQEADYLEMLERELTTEVVALLDVISTNVTSFFREAEHFKVLGELHRSKLAAGQRRFRYWCAASSTGEEPYTISMTIAEVEREVGIRSDWKLLATDISTRVLEIAGNGVYSTESLSQVPHLLRDRYFGKSSMGAGFLQATEELRSRILFRRLNLSQPPFGMKGPLQAIFCRNVMFYFDDPVRLGLLAECRRLLAKDGLLFIGKSESLPAETPGFARVSPAAYETSESSAGGGSDA